MILQILARCGAFFIGFIVKGQMNHDFAFGIEVNPCVIEITIGKSISASAFSSMALYISSRTKNILIILFSPIILYYLWLRLCRILGLPQWLDIALLIRGETLGTATSLVVFVIVIVASSALFIMEANRSME